MDSPVDPAFRPIFVIDLASDAESAVDAIRASVREAGGRLHASWAQSHLILAQRREDRKPWSPWLHVDVREGPSGHGGSEAGGSHVFARFGPHPGAWTGVVLTQIALVTIAFFAAMFAWAQHIMDRPPWAWWVILPCAIVSGGLFGMAQVGQRLSRPQMRELRETIERGVAPLRA
ncbi:MAG: hypothetical protein CMJ31_10440 [Phycisphaerae bacterium]|nr:hypothetical protein [Phycisphaerae bacterium]